jgi:3',5'-cyclic AMP phosphodiesterase CpdA
MKRSRLIFGVLILLLIFAMGLAPAANAAGEARSIEQNLARLAAGPGAGNAGQPLRFIVMGDSRTPDEFRDAIHTGEMAPFQPEVFRQAITEANLLGPALVINVGDLILGYDTPELIQAEWDDYLQTIAASQRPFVSVAGNHDVFDLDSEAVWKERIGPLYFSFDYGNSHFICLNSEEAEPHGREDNGTISAEQIDWLRADLQAHKGAQNIFVFLHKPFFMADDYPDGNWAEVHALLKEYPVRAVFAGHWHIYRRCEPRDGIEYVITGGGGAEIGDTPDLGDFHHYLLVEVNGGNMRWTVIKPGAVLSPNVVNYVLLQEVQAAADAIEVSPVIEPYLDAKPLKRITVTVKNDSAAAMETKIVWRRPSQVWKIRPMEAPIEIGPQEEATISFDVELADARWLAGGLPSLVIELPFEEGKKRIPVRKYLSVDSSPMQCLRAERPLKIDGDLSDWKGTRAMIIRPENTSNWSPADFTGGFRVMWDDQWLYFAAEIWDDEFSIPRAGSGDSSPGDLVGIGIPAGGDCRFLLLEGKPSVLRQFGEEKYRLVEQTRVAITRKGLLTVYEVALPLAEAFESVPKAGAEFDFGCYCGDQDGGSPPDWMWTGTKVVFR